MRARSRLFRGSTRADVPHTPATVVLARRSGIPTSGIPTVGDVARATRPEGAHRSACCRQVATVLVEVAVLSVMCLETCETSLHWSRSLAVKRRAHEGVAVRVAAEPGRCSMVVMLLAPSTE